jgi:hypothetical protein
LSTRDNQAANRITKTEQRVTSKLKTEERKQLARSTETAEKSAHAGAEDLEGGTLQSDTKDPA